MFWSKNRERPSLCLAVNKTKYLMTVSKHGFRRCSRSPANSAVMFRICQPATIERKETVPIGSVTYCAVEVGRVRLSLLIKISSVFLVVCPRARVLSYIERRLGTYLSLDGHWRRQELLRRAGYSRRPTVSYNSYTTHIEFSFVHSPHLTSLRILLHSLLVPCFPLPFLSVVSILTSFASPLPTSPCRPTYPLLFPSPHPAADLGRCDLLLRGKIGGAPFEIESDEIQPENVIWRQRLK